MISPDLAGTLALAFSAGIVTVLSPCVLPLLPVILTTTAQGGLWRPLGVITGFTGAFSLATLALSLLVSALGLPSEVLRGLSVLLLGTFGLVLLVPALKHRFEAWTAGLTQRSGSPRPSGGFWGGLGLGAGLGLAWTPCVGPLMASVMTLALNQQVDGGAVAVTLAFALGTSLPLYLVMWGGRELVKRASWFQKHGARIQQVFGALLLLTSLSLALGWDRHLQAWLLDTFPAWEQALTEGY